MHMHACTSIEAIPGLAPASGPRTVYAMCSGAARFVEADSDRYLYIEAKMMARACPCACVRGLRARFVEISID